MFTINVQRILTNRRLRCKISATVTDTSMLNFFIRSVFTVIDLIDYNTSFNSWTDSPQVSQENQEQAGAEQCQAQVSAS